MNKYVLIGAVCLVLNTSCSDFLELDESQYHTVDYQFSTFENVKEVATGVYGYVVDGLQDVEGTMREVATDDAVYAWDNNEIKTFYDGSWAATNLIDDQWAYYYEAIAAANYFLENCPADFPESIWQDNYKEKMEQLKNYPLEVRALRAYFHFELLKRYRQIPVVSHSLSMKEANEIIPLSYEDAVNWIVGECNAVIPHLPVTYVGTTSGELARVTKGMAQALKTRVLLYAASPLNNKEDKASKWLLAAQAAKELIDGGAYQLVDEEVVNNQEASGLIFGVWSAANNSFEKANFPIGYEGGNSGVCPSENLMEAFDLLDGTPFDWIQHQSLAFDTEARDPRFAKTILANGANFLGQTIETFIGGRNGKPQSGATPTSYYLRKFLREETSLITGNETSYQHIVPLFRIEEVLLNYAEALVEAKKDPNFTGIVDDINYILSPLDAVNLVRGRVGMPDISVGIDYNTFIKRLRNERRVELAFEGHRFWGIRRWMIGEETSSVYGLSILYQSSGAQTVNRVLVQKREWNDKMYYYPISDTELFKNKNLIQNDGWK